MNETVRATHVSETVRAYVRENVRTYVRMHVRTYVAAASSSKSALAARVDITSGFRKRGPAREKSNEFPPANKQYIHLAGLRRPSPKWKNCFNSLNAGVAASSHRGRRRRRRRRERRVSRATGPTCQPVLDGFVVPG